MQARVQSGIMQQLADITSVQRIPDRSFTEFAIGRYQSSLQEAMESGVVERSQLEELTAEETVRAYIDSQRDELEREFGVVLALDDIYRREGLDVDEELVESQTLSMYEEAQKDSQEDINVRRASAFASPAADPPAASGSALHSPRSSSASGRLAALSAHAHAAAPRRLTRSGITC